MKKTYIALSASLVTLGINAGTFPAHALSILNNSETFSAVWFAAVGTTTNVKASEISHGVDSITTFDGTSGTLSDNPNLTNNPNITVTATVTDLGSRQHLLSFTFSTGSNTGFIVPGATINVDGTDQPVNLWILDLGELVSVGPGQGEPTDGVDFLRPVNYLSATGRWFDNGGQVSPNLDYLLRVTSNSTSSAMGGQFSLEVAEGNDLGATANGVDQFTLDVTVEEVIPFEFNPAFGLLFLTGTLGIPYLIRQLSK